MNERLVSVRVEAVVSVRFWVFYFESFSKARPNDGDPNRSAREI